MAEVTEDFDAAVSRRATLQVPAPVFTHKTLAGRRSELPPTVSSSWRPARSPPSSPGSERGATAVGTPARR